MKKEEEIKKAQEEQVNEDNQKETHSENNDSCKESGSDDAAEKEPTIEEELAQAQEEILKLKDQNLRQLAEFDNYRKRTMKEKTELILNGGEKVIAALLPVLDDLERAQANLDKNQNFETLKEGVTLITKKLQDILAKQGLKRIETEEQSFDVDFHEAIAMVPVADEKQKGKVIDCVATGYMLNEKVIRHAKVAVGQ